MTDPDDRPTALAPPSADHLSESAPDTLIGTTLHDTYKVVRFLAEGGMGRVYEAHHTRIASKRFAIKVLLASQTHSLDNRLRFRREAEAAGSLSHPNVVGVHDFGYAPDGRPYIVCDYLDGKELAEVLEQRGALSSATSVSIGRQLCRALEAAHARSVIHRDMKPSNVFLVGDPNDPDVRVLDFGLSRMMEVTEAHVTQTGVIMGTPSFMSPEQARGERVDHRTDIYGVGAVLYASLTGKPPFAEETQHQTVLAVMSRDPVRPRLIVPSISPELEVVVQRAMARDPDERFMNMRELEDALMPFGERPRARLPSTVSSPPPALRSSADLSEAHGVRERAILWLVLAGVLVIFGVATAIFGAIDVLLPGRKLTLSEVLLITLAAVGSLLTPSILAVRWLLKRYWNNSARMMTLLASVRAPVVAGASAYGVLALVGRVADAMSKHVGGVSGLNASGWLGWAPFLSGAAAIVALGAILRQRLLTDGASPLRRFVAGPILFGLAAATGGAVLATGYTVRRGHDPAMHPVVPVATPEPDPSSPPISSSAPILPTQPLPPRKLPDLPAAQAVNQAMLDEAIKGGLPALTALQAQHPKDVRVLRALASELGGEPERASELLRVLDVLFSEAPAEATAADLGGFVLDAARLFPTSQRAVELMRSRMGQKGAEMLFDLMVSEPELRQKARAALETSEVQRNLSPALKIAYDLYTSPTCEARQELLAQAAQDGDERTVTVLKLVTTPTRKGCGPKKAKPCPAPCAKQSTLFAATIEAIHDRTAEAAQKTPPK